MSFIKSYEDWLQAYRKDKHKIWIRATTSDNQEYYLPNYNEWFELKYYCNKHGLHITRVGLQYRSHSVDIDTSDCDGVYLVRSLIGMIGQDSKQTITIGKVYGSNVKKTMWITPELIEELKTEDDIADCFEDALILKNEQTKTRTV